MSKDVINKQDIFQKIITKQEGEVLCEQENWSRELARAFWQQKFVSLTLAFPAGRQFLLEVKRFLERSLGEAVIIDLAIDPGIIGGVIIVCNNHYKNYALVEKMRAMALSKQAGPSSPGSKAQVLPSAPRLRSGQAASLP